MDSGPWPPPDAVETILVSRATRPGRLAFFVALLLAPVARSAGTDEDGRAMLTRARRAVASYHAGSPRSGGTLRVVYFVPADAEPSPTMPGASAA